MSDTCIKAGYARTGASPVVVDGVEFYAYRVGVLMYSRISADGQCEVRPNSRLTSYCAYTAPRGYIGKDGKAKRFRSQEAAMRAAIRALSEGDLAK